MGKGQRETPDQGARETRLARLRRRAGETAPVAAVLGGILALMVIAAVTY